MPLIPLHDANPRRYIRAHYVTIALIAANLVIYLSQADIPHAQLFETIVGFALVPARLFGEVLLPDGVSGLPAWATLVSYQFVHGSWEHVLFNMLFLWVFGDNLEDALGHRRFLAFFVACGALGGLFHAIVQPDSMSPVIGASGAVSGVLGGYIVLYPRARLLVLAFFIIPVRLPALLVIGTFFAQDLLWALTSAPAALTVAVWAHIGGFAAGAAFAALLRLSSDNPVRVPRGPWG